jgi:hypothetical protein
MCDNRLIEIVQDDVELQSISSNRLQMSLVESHSRIQGSVIFGHSVVWDLELFRCCQLSVALEASERRCDKHIPLWN